ncbi:MAG: undecaprenyl-diphosphatase UppP [Candidatus Zixiibacteriota bacterium]
MSHLFDAILFGMIQGLTEFLPISSSGHLLLAHYLLHYDPGHALMFDVALHVGTLLALVLYFWRDIGALLKGFFSSFRTQVRTPEQRLPWLILLAAIPAAIFGGLFDDFFESLRSPWIVVATFIVFGIVFLVVERVGTKTRTMNELRWRTALGIGLAQVLALVPGVSRSGVTIAAGMVAGIRRDQSARFTFLLSIPVVAGAAAKKLLDLGHHGLKPDEQGAMIAGIVSAAVVGYAVIRFLLRYLANHRLDVFAYYRFGVAGLVLLGLLALR